MDEKEIIEELNANYLSQVEEKVKITKWSHYILDEIHEKLETHFKPDTVLT